LGASIKMGAVMPRYRRENLISSIQRQSRDDIQALPFVPDDFTEAVDHAVVLGPGSFAGLQLS
jgi:hypothetical protein